MNVIVFHNTTRDHFFGYEQGHFLTEVFSYDTDITNLHAVAEDAFHLFNVGDDPAYGTPNPIAVEYRARGLRSLSVGDVVVVALPQGLKSLACASMGWTEIPVPTGARVRRAADC